MKKGEGPDSLEYAFWMGELATAAAKVWRLLDDESLPDAIAEFREIEQRTGLEDNWDC